MRPRPLALVLALASCGSPAATSADEDTGDAASSPTSSVPTTGAPDTCNLADDCPAPRPCEQVACEDNLCVVSPRDADALVGDGPGDCLALQCDGKGGGTPVPDDGDVPDDGNDCTDDVCDDGPKNLPLPAGTACNGAMVCHADQTCQPCPARDGCGDDSPAEPNETQPAAAARPTVTDAADPSFLCEVLGGPADVDWFVFDALDTAMGAVDPRVAAPGDLDVCIYVQCKAGGTSLTCPEGMAAAVAPLGQQGCCGGGTIEPTIACNGFDADATVWLRVAHAAAGEPPDCLNYQLGYGY